MTYRFDDISAQAFQSLAQAISVAVFGPGVKVFGDGPDGGREASFDGPYQAIRTHGSPWSGYGILQAKCRQRARHNSSDTTWLLTQLRADLDKFLDEDRGLRKPEYYVIITNVTLSSIAGDRRGNVTGGKERVEKLFETYRARIGLKGWLVWDSSELSAHLDGNASIRNAYRDWITTGDVLSNIIEGMSSPFLKEKLHIRIARDLRSDRDVKTKEARQNTSQNISLHDLFIDVPLEPNQYFHQLTREAKEEAADADGLTASMTSDLQDFGDYEVRRDNTVAQLARLAADKLDGESLRILKENSVSRLQKVSPNRIVVLGGPGQGKSTLGQFFTQIARSRLISQSARLMTNENSVLVESILSRAAEQNIKLSGPYRFPVRVELPKYADAVGNSPAGLSIIDYIIKSMTAPGEELKADELRKLLRDYPWQVVLDGLDEVPASGSRTEVLENIAEFCDEISICNGDVLVIVTSRKQGYGFELNPHHWMHWTLAALSPNEAMSFAKRQAEASISDPERRETVLAKMEKASNDSATSSLLVTPLQVSMVFALAEVYDDIPSDRWTLFNRHYEVLRDREAAKGGAAADIIRKYKSIVDDIHRTAGLFLHVRAEMVGAADAFFTKSEFESLVTQTLETEGQTGEAASLLKDELVNIATNRLVMLNCRVEGQVAFDVRSLQEFMAAWCLMTGRESSFMERLRIVATKSHWRHVFRIAVSKIFGSEPRHLRRDIVALCQSSNSQTQSLSNFITKAGSELAIDLLEDNVATNFQALREQFLMIALDAVSLGPIMLPDALISVLQQEMSERVRSRIVDAIASSDRQTALSGAAIALATLDSRLCDALHAVLPSEPHDLLKYLYEINFAGQPDRINELAISAAEDVGFGECLGELASIARKGGDAEAGPNVFLTPTLLNQEPHEEMAPFFKSSGAHAPSIRFVPIPTKPLTKFPRLERPQWAYELAAVTFSESPDKAGLAAALRIIGALEELPRIRHNLLAWPLYWIIRRAIRPADLVHAAALAEVGHFGDSDDWRTAEFRWMTKGLSADDLNNWDLENPFEDIARVGAPPPYHVGYGSNREQADNPNHVISLLDKVKDIDTKWRLGRIAIYGTRARKLDQAEAKVVLDTIKLRLDQNIENFPNTLCKFFESLPDDLFFDRGNLEILNKIILLKRMRLIPPSSVGLERAISAAVLHPDLRGLIVYPFQLILLRLHQSSKRRPKIKLPSTHSEISAEHLMKPLPDDPPNVLHLLNLLDLLRGCWNEEHHLGIASFLAARSVIDLRPSLDVIMLQNRPLADKANFIRLVDAAVTGLQGPKKVAIAALRAAADQEVSALCDPAILSDLGLAIPYYMVATHAV